MTPALRDYLLLASKGITLNWGWFEEIYKFADEIDSSKSIPSESVH